MEFGLRLANALISIPSNYILNATLIIFLHCFYDPNLTWTKKKALLFLPIILIYAGFAMFGETVTNLVGFFFTPFELAILVYDYPGKKLRPALKLFFATLVFSFIISNILMVALQYFSPGFSADAPVINDAEQLFVHILSMIFAASILPYLYRRLYKPGVFIKCGKRERTFLWIYYIAGIVVAVLTSRFEGETILPEPAILKIMAGSMVLLAIIVPVFVYSSRITEHFVFQTQYQDGYMQTELEHFRQYKQAQEETKRFRHDVKNDLLCLKGMLSAGKTEEANAYLQNLVEVTEALGEKYVTGDEILDSILAAKGAVMEKEQVDFQLDGVLAGGLPWKPVDTCCVFANAIDNAIEACMQVPPEERYISMKIKTASQFWFVRIENPVKEDIKTELLFQRVGGYTSKKDSSRHGIGTYSIKHAAESNGGIVKAECADRRFALEIMIPQ